MRSNEPPYPLRLPVFALPRRWVSGSSVDETRQSRAGPTGPCWGVNGPSRSAMTSNYVSVRGLRARAGRRAPLTSDSGFSERSEAVVHDARRCTNTVGDATGGSGWPGGRPAGSYRARPRTAQALAVSGIDPSGLKGRRTRSSSWSARRCSSVREMTYPGAGPCPPRNGLQ